MPFAPPSGISLAQIASNGLRFTDLYSSSDRFQLTSIQWDGDVYDLPREMLWDLPSQYLLTNYSKVPTPVYNLDGSLEEVQEVVDGVLDRMEEGYVSIQGINQSRKSETGVSSLS